MIQSRIKISEKDIVYSESETREYEEATGHHTLVICQKGVPSAQDTALTIRTSKEDAPLSWSSSSKRGISA